MINVRNRAIFSAAAAAIACAIALPAAAQLEDGEFNAEWFYGNAQQREAHAALAGKKAPKLEVTDWVNAEDVIDLEDGFTWKDLEGKVVLLDYWATW